MKKLLLLLILITSITQAQNTVGTINNTSGSYVGYTLLSPLNSTSTYLINNCGEVINQWSSSYTPGASVYLLENGNLLRTGRITNPNINFGGVGGAIELYDWDGNILWNYTYTSSTYTQHHDIYPLSNGNILVLSAEIMSQQEAIQAGRDPSLLQDGQVFNEQVIELQPIGSNQANIVWEWNFKDHLIQDVDASKNNFGIIENNPQRLNFNYTNTVGSPENWLHINSLQYNENLDQIILSSRILSEIYIIDHSTTTAEAAGTTGGTYGKGGDILYRWGNKEAYNKGDSSDRQLYGQHYPHWIPDGFADAGKIMIFNNGDNTRPFSSIEIIDPLESSPGHYIYDSTNGFAPLVAEYSYTAPVNTDFFSSILSSGQRLPNGNTLICDGDSGYFFEIDSNENIVWEYVNPDGFNGIFNQGDDPQLNFVFRAIKFAPDYPAFTGRDLTPGPPIEGNPDLSDCMNLSIDEFDLAALDIKIYPNPVQDVLKISYNEAILNIEIFSILGKKIKTVSNTKSVDLANLNAGMYIVKIQSENGFLTQKIIKK
ncbi:aryl-sulfate sulfotransferase [Lacinutrix chionoecetis]